MEEEHSGFGLSALFASIIGCGIAAFIGATVVMPAIDKWNEGNAQVASINGQTEIAVATVNGTTAIQVNKDTMDAQIIMNRDTASSQVQIAALDLAADTVHASSGTINLMVGMAAFCASGGMLLVAIYFMTRPQPRKRKKHKPSSAPLPPYGRY